MALFIEITQRIVVAFFNGTNNKYKKIKTTYCQVSLIVVVVVPEVDSLFSALKNKFRACQCVL
jgi:hypothetical protein